MVASSYVLQSGKFKAVGELMAVSIVQGGSGFPFFSECMFKYLCGADIRSIRISLCEVPHYSVKTLLEKVQVYSAYLFASYTQTFTT